MVESMVLRLLVIAVVLVLNLGSASTREILVGQGNGMLESWGCCETDYSDWAATYNIIVGDLLVFYLDGSDTTTLAEVSEKEYNSCPNLHPAKIYWSNDNPVEFKLNKTGFRYFISTGDTCRKQRLRINVESPDPLPNIIGRCAVGLMVAVLAGTFIVQFFRKNKETKNLHFNQLQLAGEQALIHQQI